MGFPDHVIHSVHSRVKRKHFREQRSQQKDPHEDGEEDRKPTISIPHNEFVNKYVRPVFTGNNFQVVSPASNSMRSRLVSNRPPRTGSVGVDPSQCVGVYRVPCQDCDECYYGETGRSFEVRIGEHQSAVRNKDSKNACYKHVSTTKHNIDWNEADILFVSDDWYKRLVVESSCIVTKPNFNNMRSTLAVDKFSAQLILGTCKNISIH